MTSTLILVMLGTYAAATISLSALVVLLWHAGLRWRVSGAGDLLALRLLPATGACLLASAVIFPAFLEQEPLHATDESGPLLWGLALIAVVVLGDALRRGWHAWRATEDLQAAYRVQNWIHVQGHQIGVVDTTDPIVAVLGARRPYIIAASPVITVCSAFEFRQVVAHELAHVSARDNLKFFFLSLSPDVLAWLPLHAVLIKRWREATEFQADSSATGTDRHKRLALASALIKVARLGIRRHGDSRALSMPVASDDIEGRVRRLLGASAVPDRPKAARWLALCLVCPLCVVPFYPTVQRFVEILVAFGR